MNDADIIVQFCAAMRERDIEVNEADIVADGVLHRVKAVGDRDKSVWYVLHADERPAGAYGCNRRYGYDTKFSWRASAPQKEWSAAEKRAWREKMQRIEKERREKQNELRADAARQANAIWDIAQECVDDDHPYLQRKGVKSHGLRVGVWTKIDRDTGEVYTISKRALLVPIKDVKKNIHSLQAIFPTKQMAGRDKDFLTDGAKEGFYHTIGKPLEIDGKKVIMIGEGYATCASVHEATGHAVVVALDVPNLLPVARTFRKHYEDAIIVMLADNDQWTLEPVENPGVTRARECCKEVGALLAIPPFDPDLGKDDGTGRLRGPTDFNDLQAMHGHEAIAAVIDAVLANIEPDPPADDVPPWDIEGELVEPLIDGDLRPENNGYFTILGYDRGRFYIFLHGMRQVGVYTKSDMSDAGLIEMAPLGWWEMNFPGTGRSGGINRKMAINFIIRTAEKLGVYDPSKIRGRGAWFDEGRSIYHHGGYLTVDGERMEIVDLESQYVYELARSLPDPADTPITTSEGAGIINLMKMFRWSKPGSALLFSGWIALAPVCGAIPWRPHIWMAGGAGSGKSTLAKLAHGLLRGTDVFAQGNSTEAGIRQKLKADARPVIMDESESTEEGDAKRVQSILSLIRQSSTESDAETLKGTVDGSGMTFHIRSMFCLASIQVALKNKADIDRLSVLNLRSGREVQSDPNSWKVIKEAIYTTVDKDPDISQRLLRRAIDLLPTTLKNIDVFSDVAARIFGSQREGDQYGALLAGAWSLISDGVATSEQAEELIKRYDWSEHMDGADEDESSRALAALMEGKIRVSGGIYATVYELVKEASGYITSALDGIGRDKADAILQGHGMSVRDRYLLISNTSQEVRRMVRDTPFSADLRGLLLRLPHSDRNNNRPFRFSGVQTKCIRVLLDPILEDTTRTVTQGKTTDDLYDDTEPF